jgi:hypothetical protein
MEKWNFQPANHSITPRFHYFASPPKFKNPNVGIFNHLADLGIQRFVR